MSYTCDLPKSHFFFSEKKGNKKRYLLVMLFVHVMMSYVYMCGIREIMFNGIVTESVISRGFLSDLAAIACSFKVENFSMFGN